LTSGLGKKWKDKFASGFTYSARKATTSSIRSYSWPLSQHKWECSEVLVGDPPGKNWGGGRPKENNRLGSWLGLMSQSNANEDADLTPSKGDQRPVERHSRRVAEIVRHWKREGEYRTERLVETAR